MTTSPTVRIEIPGHRPWDAPVPGSEQFQVTKAEPDCALEQKLRLMIGDIALWSDWPGHQHVIAAQAWAWWTNEADDIWLAANKASRLAGNPPNQMPVILSGKPKERRRDAQSAAAIWWEIWRACQT